MRQVKIINYYAKSITDKDGFTQITISPGAYGILTLNNEIKKILIGEEPFTEAKYPFTIKPIFSTLGSVIEISRQEPIISLLPDDSVRDFFRI